MSSKKLFRKKSVRRKEYGVAEPVRTSVYDLVLENMQLMNRNVFMHRLIYIGEHDIPADNTYTIGHRFREIVETVNDSGRIDAQLTGFLLHYSRYFMHVLDGSEEAIRRHLQLLFANEMKTCIGTVKVLVCYHNISQQFLKTWMDLESKISHLVGKIPLHLDAAESRSKILLCITKLYRFGYMLRANENKRESVSAISTTESLLKLRSKANPSLWEIKEDVYKERRSNTRASMVEMATARHVFNVPEQQLIEFLLASPYLMTLAEYLQEMGQIPTLHTYYDRAWPVSTDFIPHNIFDEEYDPVTDIVHPRRKSSLE